MNNETNCCEERKGAFEVIISPVSKDTRNQFSAVSNFLTSVLIEVIAENYRHLLHHSAFKGKEPVDPPIRDNEVVLSGLFSTAISRICPRYRAEARIDRSAVGAQGDGKSYGRVDFMAWLGHSVVAIELKAAHMSFDATNCISAVSEKWEKALDQAKSALDYFNSQAVDCDCQNFSVALVAVIGRRVLSKSENNSCDDDFSRFDQAIGELRPDYYARYTIPADYRRVPFRKHGENQTGKETFNPVVGFAAKILDR